MANNPLQTPASSGVVPRAHYGDQQLARVLAAASTNATLVKNSPGTLEEIVLFNTTAAAIFIKFYDSATIPTAGAGTPAFTLELPVNGAPVVIAAGLAKPFLAGIGYTITGAIADSDATAVAVNSVTGYLLWS